MSDRKAKRFREKRIASLLHRLLGETSFSFTVGKAGGLSIDRCVFIACQKVKYGHKATAERAAVVMHNKTGDDFDAYYCRRCKAWHIGHSRKEESNGRT